MQGVASEVVSNWHKDVPTVGNADASSINTRGFAQHRQYLLNDDYFAEGSAK